MTVAFELPDLGEGVAEGELLAWHVDVGDRVEADDVLAEVETDKAAVEVPSPVAGTIAERHAEVGDVVETGSVLVTIEESAERAAAEPGERAVAPEDDDTGQPSRASGPTRTFASPFVRRLARERGVDLATVEGSGPGGRVTEDDVRTVADTAEATGSTSVTATASSEGAAAGESAETDSTVTSAVRRVNRSDEPAPGDDTTVTSAVRRVGDEDAAPEEDPPTGSDDDGSTDRERTFATPATRTLARDLGVDLDAVPTNVTRDGEPFIDEAAVRAYAAAGAEGEPATDEPADARAIDEPVADRAAGATDGPTGVSSPVPDAPGDRREPYRGVRRRIGEQMDQGWREVPHATHHDRVEVSDLVAARERLAPLAAERDVELTATPIVVKCVAAALAEHPILNTHFDATAEQVVFKEAINVGVATTTDRGLLVPVLEDVDQRGLIDVAAALADRVAAARDGSIERAAMEGATFTVTNVGAIGGEYATPLVNVPQTAILATGALRERPTAIEGEVVARPTIPLSLAVDNRVVDGADAARFVETLKTYLQDPTRLLLG